MKPGPKPKYKDPVDELDAQRQEDVIEQEQAEIQVELGITEASFKPIPETAERFAHPFEGYPKKVDLKIVSDPKHPEKFNEHSGTDIMVLSHKVDIHQDPAGIGLSVLDTKTNKERKVTMKTEKSYMLPNHEEGGQNIDVVFDRYVLLDGGKLLPRAAYIPWPSVRAQLVYSLDPKGRIKRNPEMLLYDTDQLGRLKRLFLMIHSPVLRAERISRAVMGESQETLEEIPQSETEAIGG